MYPPQITNACTKVLDLDVSSPLMKVLAGLEYILKKAQVSVGNISMCGTYYLYMGVFSDSLIKDTSYILYSTLGSLRLGGVHYKWHNHREISVMKCSVVKDGPPLFPSVHCSEPFRILICVCLCVYGCVI